MVLYKRKKNTIYCLHCCTPFPPPIFGNAATTEESEEEILFITSYNSDTKYTYDNISTFVETYTQLGGKIFDHGRKYECNRLNAGASMEKKKY